MRSKTVGLFRNAVYALFLSLGAMQTSHAVPTPVIGWDHDDLFGTRVFLTGLQDSLITGVDLTIRWPYDNYILDFVVPRFSLSPPGFTATTAYVPIDGASVCQGSSFLTYCTVPESNDFRWIRVVQRLVNASDYVEYQEAQWAQNGGEFDLFRLILEPIEGPGEPPRTGPAEPTRLFFSSATIYGEGGRIIYSVPEPSTLGLGFLGLIGLGLARLSFSRRKKLN